MAAVTGKAATETPEPAGSSPRARQLGRQVIAIGSVLGVGLVIAAVGSYAFGWSWTGFRGNTVFAWLKLLLVPLVLAAQPLWIRARRMGRRSWPWATLLGGAVIAFIVIAYEAGWSWTGFEGHTLWDWLNLVVLPVALGFVGLLVGDSPPPPLRYWKVFAGLTAVTFLILVVGGYALGWAWTGFEGNNLSDWLNLLLLPFALPAVFLWMNYRLDRLDEAEERELAAEEKQLASEERSLDSERQELRDEEQKQRHDEEEKEDPARRTAAEPGVARPAGSPSART